MRLIALPLIVFAVACSTPPKLEQPITMEEQIVQEVLPIVSFEPSMWETTGASIAPVLQLAGPALRALEFEFTYEGPGQVTTSASVSVAEGQNQVSLEGFSCEPVENPGEGVVNVYVRTVDDQLVQVAEWSVVQRPSIIRGLTHMSTEVVHENDMFACLVAIEFDPLEETFSSELVAERDVQFEAWVKEQGAYHPSVRITPGVQRDDFPNLARDFEFEGDHYIVLVCVERSKLPPRGRAYLTLQATMGGDTHEKNVALPTR